MPDYGDVLGAGPNTPDSAFADFLRFINQGRRAPGMNPPGLQNARPNPFGTTPGRMMGAAVGPGMVPQEVQPVPPPAPIQAVPAPSPVVGPEGPFPAQAARAPSPVASPDANWADVAQSMVGTGADLSQVGPQPAMSPWSAAAGQQPDNPWANAPNPWGQPNPWAGAPNPWAPANPLNAQTMAMIGPPGQGGGGPPGRRGAGDGDMDAREREVTKQLNENETRRARGQPSQPNTAVAQGTEAYGPQRKSQNIRIEERPNGKPSKAPRRDANAQAQMMDYDRWLFDPSYGGPGNAMKQVTG